MEHLELGKVFKVNVNDKTVYLKVEPEISEYSCEECYFKLNNNNCFEKTISCHKRDRQDNINIIYKQINPIQDIFVIFGQRKDGFVKQCGAYPNEEDAKKKVEELNKHYIDVAHHYEKIQYYPYGIVNDIKEVKINQLIISLRGSKYNQL